MIDKRKNEQYKTMYCPYYDRKAGCWRISFPDRDSEEGDLLYIASEFVRGGLFFPYNNKVTKNKEYTCHSHYFEGVICALLEDPEEFSIEGLESYYSDQEQEFLRAIQRKLQNSHKL